VAQFIWSILVLVASVGFGVFYLAKQLGYFGGLGIERLGLAKGRWTRVRRRLTAVLLITLGVLSFLSANWLLPWLFQRKDVVIAAAVILALVVLFVVVFIMALLEAREIRNLARRLRRPDRARLTEDPTRLR